VARVEPTPGDRLLPREEVDTVHSDAATIREAIFSMCSSATGSTATSTLIAMHRSPAEPKPAFTAESATRSRSASGSTSMWFFAPPSAWTRLP
jgi:hypothetical protein